MYLGMTEDEFKSVYDGSVSIVAKRIGINDAESNSISDLLELIKISDSLAHDLLVKFRAIYEHWWRLSTEVGNKPQEQKLNEEVNKVTEAILTRDETRKSLIAYLNSKYGAVK